MVCINSINFSILTKGPVKQVGGGSLVRSSAAAGGGGKTPPSTGCVFLAEIETQRLCKTYV